MMDKEAARLRAWFRGLRDDICAALETLEAGDTRFDRRRWRRTGAVRGVRRLRGGGEAAVLRDGRVFEKAAVLVSQVAGELPEALRGEVAGGEDAPHFRAGGISVIVHPRNPHVPAVHMNTRHIATSRSWFGGGADLTPMLARDRNRKSTEARAFHAALKRACDAYAAGAYKRFAKECDAYFFLPHRKRTRGIGGIFYDHLNSGDFDADFAFTKNVGRAFLEAYPAIVARRMGAHFSEREREEQLMERGRYAEFNLLYDRGTRFGLHTGGDVEAILSSLPPLVRWP